MSHHTQYQHGRFSYVPALYRVFPCPRLCYEQIYVVSRCRPLAAHGAKSCLSVRTPPLTATGVTFTDTYHAIPHHGHWCTFIDLYRAMPYEAKEPTKRIKIKQTLGPRRVPPAECSFDGLRIRRVHCLVFFKSPRRSNPQNVRLLRVFTRQPKEAGAEGMAGRRFSPGPRADGFFSHGPKGGMGIWVGR